MANRLALEPPRRNAPFVQEPGFYLDAGLWLYGNVQLLGESIESIPLAHGMPFHTPSELDQIERLAEQVVLAGKVVIAGVHSPAHQRAAIVPLRWGAPRILVLSGGFRFHLGEKLKTEPFRAARLWRFEFDPKTDLVISRRAPDRLPTYARHNPTVDRLIHQVACHSLSGVLFERWS